MMWVRFPNGQCIQYNTASYVRVWHGPILGLYKSKADSEKYTDTIALVPDSCVIEFVHACRVSNPLDTMPNESQVSRELRSIKRKLAKKK